MAEAETVYILCVEWKDRAVPSYSKDCCECGITLCVSKAVTDEGGYPKGAQYICTECMTKKIAERSN